MAYREVLSVEIREIIRRWQAGLSQRRIARGTGLSRQTVRRYVEAAEAAGLKPGGPEPGEEQLARLATLSSTRPRQVAVPSEELLAPWAEQVEGWLTAERLQVTPIHELLAERGCEVSYSTLRRFIRRRGWRQRQPVTVRMEDGPPGEVAELDFGRLGYLRDPESGRRRTVWALIVVWRYSRHCFVWPTTSQTLHAVVEGLEATWAFFEGVPRYLVIDNFPAAVAGADALHPRLTRGFLEYARQRGFITDPARVCRPRDKPRVERSFSYVRERFFKGAAFRDLAEMRAAARRWSLEVAGQRIHGTTHRRPLEAHRRLLAGTRLAEHGGRTRTVQNWIGGSDYNPCVAAFVPPPHELVDELLSDLSAFCNDDSLPAVAQAAIAHAQFETIHPFVDGNGRTGRALLQLVLRRRGLAPRILPPISLILATWPRDYVAGLTGTRYEGAPDSEEGLAGINRWIALVASASRRAAEDAARFEKQLRALQDSWRGRLRTVRRGSAADLLLGALPGAPLLTATTASDLIGRSFQATS